MSYMVMLFNLWCYIVHQTVKYCVVSIWRSLEQALFVLTRLTGNLAVAGFMDGTILNSDFDRQQQSQ
jgi:hypothetical protein